MGLLIVPPETRWQVLLSTAFGGASDAAGAVRRGGIHLMQCGRYACARRCEDRTLRHAVAYVAVYKAGAALRSADASDAAGAVRRGGLRLLQCGRYACAQRCEDRTPRHAVAYAAVYKAGAALRSAVRPTRRRRATWRSPPPAMWALRLCPALRGPHAEARCSVRRRL
jgi:hypothetical protein